MKLFTLSALTLATVASSLTFTSCKKDKDDPKPQSRTELLTAKNWRLSASTSVNGSVTTDRYAAMPACRKDDFLKFNSDKSLVNDEGLTRCGSNDPQSRTLVWELTANDTKLGIRATPSSSSQEVYDVVELSASTLKFRENSTSNGVTRTETLTYTSF